MQCNLQEYATKPATILVNYTSLSKPLYFETIRSFFFR